MLFFTSENRQQSAQSDRIFAAYEIVRTFFDFLAAICFLVGSILFFAADTQFQATWLFVVGSLFFCLKPTLKLAREVHLWRVGELQSLARRTKD